MADDDGFTPAIISESTARLKRLSVSVAVTVLDMTGTAVLVFRHAAHGGIGHFGWTDPAAGGVANAH